MINLNNQKIVFIASYMKSGNTWMRSIVCSLLNNGKFEIEDLKRIKLFSQETYFAEFSDPIFQENGNYDFNFVTNKWIKAQAKINSSVIEKLKFIKTHSIRGVINNNYFTDENVCKGFVYLIRDPRDISVSLAKHMGITIDDAIDIILFQKNFVTNAFKINEAVCTWDQHIKSWVNFKNVPRLIIKYEDMVMDNKSAIKKVADFLMLLNNDVIITENTILKTLENTSFNNLKKLEKENGFIEATKNNNFFRKGKSGQWSEKLTHKQIILINTELDQTMKALEYI